MQQISAGRMLQFSLCMFQVVERNLGCFILTGLCAPVLSSVLQATVMRPATNPVPRASHVFSGFRQGLSTHHTTLGLSFP